MPLPVVAGWFISGLLSWIGQIIVAALLYLGLQLFSESVVQPALMEQFANHWGGIPAQIASGLAYVNVDKAITIIISALIASTAANAGRVHLKRKRP